MNPPVSIEDDYIAEFNARRKYAPESVISFADLGIPELTEDAVRKMIKAGKVVLTNFDNIKLCSMGQLIRKIHATIQNPTQILNITRMILSLKECDANEFLDRMDKSIRLVETIISEQGEECGEPQVIEENPTGGSKKPKAKEPKEPKEPKAKEPKEPKAKEPKEPKVKEPKEPKNKEPKVKVKEPKVQPKVEATKKQSIPKKVKNDVWNTYIGEGIARHRCLCCKRATIDKTDFHCGHVISEKDGGALSINNLRPICASCNNSMKCDNMIEFVKRHEYFIG